MGVYLPSTWGHPQRGVAPRNELCKQSHAHLRVTVAPAASRASLAFSASSFLAFSRTGFGALSTRSLASFRPRLVRPRTSLMTWIFLSPAYSRMTSNSSFSSSAGAASPPAAGAPAAATATGAAADTSKVSSKPTTVLRDEILSRRYLRTKSTSTRKS